MKQRKNFMTLLLFFSFLQLSDFSIPVQEMINNRNRSVVRDMKWSLHLSFTPETAVSALEGRFTSTVIPGRSLGFFLLISRGADCQKPT